MTRAGRNSSAQRYKIKYKTETLLFIKIKRSLIMRIRYSAERAIKPMMKIVWAEKISVYERRMIRTNRISAVYRKDW